MNHTINRLQTLQVSDVMRADIVSVSHNASTNKAAELMLTNNISGMPVIDESGHCVGIVSAHDLVRQTHSGFVSADNRGRGGEFQLQPAPTTAAGLAVMEVPRDRVAAHMTSAVQTVTPETPLAFAARVMCSQHIHRLPVLDHAGHPVGLVSSTDILAAVVKALTE